MSPSIDSDLKCSSPFDFGNGGTKMSDVNSKSSELVDPVQLLDSLQGKIHAEIN